MHFKIELKWQISVNGSPCIALSFGLYLCTFLFLIAVLQFVIDQFLFFSSQLKGNFEEYFEEGKEQGGAYIREEKVLNETIEMSQRKKKDEASVSWSDV